MLEELSGLTDEICCNHANSWDEIALRDGKTCLMPDG